MLSQVSAAALWGLADWDHRSPEVTVAGSATRLHLGLRVHRSSVLLRLSNSPLETVVGSLPRLAFPLA
ncbi:MAG TPA: hypothetical protein VGV40_07915 [Solirubrobacteraceae bacterium]|nr:hypothetical protein [Solirubrobacteraceae bacterium]